MAINELSIKPFYIVYYVFIKRKQLASTVTSIVYKRKTICKITHFSKLLDRHIGLVIIFIIFTLIFCISLTLLPPNLCLFYKNAKSQESLIIAHIKTTEDCEKSLFEIYTYSHLLPLPLLHSHHHLPHPVTERQNHIHT